MLLSGVGFSILAMLAWTFGDFAIHRATKELGIWKSIFWIGAIAVLVMSPWAFSDLQTHPISPQHALLLGLACVIGFIAAISNFYAWKIGKLSVIQPVLGLEVLVTAGLSWILVHEVLTIIQFIFILLAFIGFIFVSLTASWKTDFRKRGVEKGVLVAFLGAILLGASSVMHGIMSRALTPILLLWSTHLFIACCSAGIIIRAEGFRWIKKDLQKHSGLILFMAVVDNIAWLSYGYATTLLPIAVATTIGLGYVPLSSILGVTVNREKLTTHQLFGIFLILVSVFFFGYTAST